MLGENLPGRWQCEGGCTEDLLFSLANEVGGAMNSKPHSVSQLSSLGQPESWEDERCAVFLKSQCLDKTIFLDGKGSRSEW